MTRHHLNPSAHRHLRITCITLKSGRPHIDMTGSPSYRQDLRHTAACRLAWLSAHVDVRWFRSAAARLPTMGEVQVVQVDERDSGWENSRPRFRVYLHGSGPKSTYGWTDTYDVTGADVLQVIDWAQRQAGDSLTYAVALVHDDPARGQMDPGSGRGLVWLVGMDGNTNPINPEEAETLDRMLARRREAVGVPLADRMPAGAPDPYNDGTQRR